MNEALKPRPDDEASPAGPRDGKTESAQEKADAATLKAICRTIGHQFPPLQLWQHEEPETKLCTFCGTRVERIARRA